MKKTRLLLILPIFALLTGCAIDSGSTTSSGEALQVDPTPSPTVTSDPFAGEGPWEVTLTETISGSLIGLDNQAVILLPMYPGDSATWQPFIDKASEAGISTLTLIPDDEDTLPLQSDLLLAIEEAMNILAEREITTIFLAGPGDAGISAVAAGNAYSDRLAGIVLISIPWSNGIDAVTEEDLRALKLPTLWLAARQDMINNSEEMIVFVDPSLITLWIYEGSSLRGTYLLEGLDSEDMISRMLGFMGETAQP